MFRLIRLVVLLMLAFVAGLFFERDRQSKLCQDLGGRWSETICQR
jgi:hypothetical protein